LKKFNGTGNFFNWWESYRVLVHDNPNFPDDFKFAKLMQSLEGNAETIVGGFEQTFANYDETIDLLKKNYQKDDKAIEDLYKRLSRLNVCSNFVELKNFHLELEVICRRLISRGKQAKLESPFICSELERKVTKQVKREIFKKKTAAGNTWNTTSFRTALADIILLEERLYANSEPKQVDKKKKAPEKQIKQEEAGTYAAVDANNRSRKQSKLKQEKKGFRQKTPNTRTKNKEHSKQKPTPKYPCTFCSEPNHFPSDCPTYNTIEARTAKSKELERCTSLPSEKL
jgi:hypothetical protein